MLRFIIALCFLYQIQPVLSQNNINLNALPEVSDYTVIRSNPGADTVMLTLHGGPESTLFEGRFSFFEDISTFSVVDVMQYTHLNPEVLLNHDISFDKAISVNDTSVALLRKAVVHYRAMGKKSF